MRSDNTRQRLLTVLDFLKQYSDSGHPQSTGEILTELKKYGIESERKAIYRDIEALREFGFDIRLTGTPKRGYYLASRDFAGSQPFIGCCAVGGVYSQEKHRKAG